MTAGSTIPICPKKTKINWNYI